jgi:hypothetical protein
MLGPPPKPNALRIAEGLAGHRPLRRELAHARGLPLKPKGMSAAASKCWDRLIADLDPQTLRRADQDALRALAEDEALLWDAYLGLRKNGCDDQEQSEGCR